METSIMHHVIAVLFGIWLLDHFNRGHPIVFFISVIYLYLVHEIFVLRLRKKLQFEERKQLNQKRVLSDSESVRWLNHAIEKIWPICMEQIASQKLLRPVIPWFLEKYRPWTAKKALVQHLYLGRSPPFLTDMRVLRQCSGDDHLVMEFGMNFLTADDMSAILAVKLRKRLGFGMWAKLHLTGMHVEGKVLVGIKFLRRWPFLGRVRVCFVEPPYFQMTVKPISTHSFDVAVIPGIAGWLEKLLSVAFEQTLVEPNMLVVDIEKLVSPQAEDWLFVDEKKPIAYALVEIMEGTDMKPSDLNGLADPYVKGQLGPYRFKTEIKKKTLSPKWQEEFKMPICTWDSPNNLNIEVRDKDRFVDDLMGDCKVDVAELRDGQRHDMWLPLRNIKMGRIHLAITVIEDNSKYGGTNAVDGESPEKEGIEKPSEGESASNESTFSSMPSVKSRRLADNIEPIKIEGQREAGVWVYQPGSEVSQTWESRKGRDRLNNHVYDIQNNKSDTVKSVTPTLLSSEISSLEQNPAGLNLFRTFGRKCRRMASTILHRRDDRTCSSEDVIESPHVNVRASNLKDSSINLVLEDSGLRPSSAKAQLERSTSRDSGDMESPREGKARDVAKNIMKQAGESARNIRHVFSRKGSRKSRQNASTDGCDVIAESSESSDSNVSPDAITIQDNKTSTSFESDENVDSSVRRDNIECAGEMVIAAESKGAAADTGRSLERGIAIGESGLNRDDDGVSDSPPTDLQKNEAFLGEK